MRWVVLSLVVFLVMGAAHAAPPITAKSSATVKVHPDRTLRALDGRLFGTNISVGDKNLISDSAFLSRVKTMGVTSCRFPNGCQADKYNWKAPNAGQVTVEEFLDFCEQIHAEPYYTVNMQGGTEGLKGPVPEDAALDERIKYQHNAPNPCGNTDYHFGTLAETLELVQKHTIDRAIAGRKPILTYEMGNENWGQATTDWPPEVYARTIEVYAKAMRKLVDDAAAKHAELKGVKLYIVAVGFPVMGNNMKLTDTPDRKINLAWTSALNKLHQERVVDAVQEHFYPYGSANGGTIAWAVHNLHNIIYARKGRANPRLNSYRDPEIAYSMPMEHTEWNVKCWGGRFKDDVKLANADFESGLSGWTIDGPRPFLSGEAARRGDRGLSIMLEEGQKVSIEQVFQLPETAKSASASLWVRSDRPEAVNVSMEQLNSGENAGKKLGEYSSKNTGMWSRVAAGGKVFEDTTHILLSIRVTGPARVFLDEASLHYTNEDRGQVALSATTYEQQLFCVDALREMALGGCPRAHIHHLVGDYACGSMTAKGEIKDLGKVFQLFAGAYGDQIVQADAECKDFSYHSSGHAWATDFNALAPDREDIPELGCMATRKGNVLYLLLINRTSDRQIDVNIDLGADPSDSTASVRVLSGKDIDLPGATLSQGEKQVSREFTQSVAPYSAQIVTIKL